MSHTYRLRLLQVLRVVADKKRVAQTNLKLHRAFENFISLDGPGLQQDNNFLAAVRFLIAVTCCKRKKIKGQTKMPMHLSRTGVGSPRYVRPLHIRLPLGYDFRLETSSCQIDFRN
jgi:hypothetical protein